MFFNQYTIYCDDDNLLDENYVKSLNSTVFEVKRFYVDSADGYKLYGAYDNNDNLFIFKTKGVMQYTVFLDDYTVEI